MDYAKDNQIQLNLNEKKILFGELVHLENKIQLELIEHDTNGCYPLLLAIVYNNPEMVKLIINYTIESKFKSWN